MAEQPGVPKPRAGEGADEHQLSRYRLETDPLGLVCLDSPNIALIIERGLMVTASARARYPSRTIFVDGVFAGPPFLDNKAQQYSLDHHVGCTRPFMLASCEQAAVIVLQGLPLADGMWRIYVNDPDLDALLAAWLLLNHRVLSADGHRLLRRAMPLIRVEGLIDAHGLDMEALLALPHRLYEAEKARISELRAEEVALKAAGRWEKVDLLSYANKLFDRLDDELLEAGMRRRFKQNEARLQARKLAVLSTANEGIYEVETQLRQRYQDELGIIILDQGKGRMTLRLVDPFMPFNLSDVYELLNEHDPNVLADSQDRWGGSHDIGGSPRRYGTGLRGIEVLRLVAASFSRPIA